MVAYNPYESEVREVLETDGTNVVLAAAVVARTENVRLLTYGGPWGAAGNGSTAGWSGYGAPLATTGLGQSGSVTGGQRFNGSVTKSSQLPVTAGAGRGTPIFLNYVVAAGMLGAAVGLVLVLWYELTVF